MKAPRRALVVLAVALSLVTAACGSDDDSGSGAAPAANAGSNTVALKLIAFQPERMTVPPGTTVTWRNEDAADHTVTSGTVTQSGGGVTSSPDNKFDSRTLGGGKTFTFTFQTPGTYPYFCTLHPATMRGEITVS